MQSVRKNARGVTTREVLRSNDTAKRSAEIVVAARELYEEKGLAHKIGRASCRERVYVLV